MAYTERLSWETLRSIDTATAPFNTGVYTPIGGPLLFPSYILKMVNNSNVLVTVSIDGGTDIDVCPSGGFWLYDEGKVGQTAHIPAVSKGTQIYIKGVAGTGLIYLVSQFIIQN